MQCAADAVRSFAAAAGCHCRIELGMSEAANYSLGAIMLLGDSGEKFQRIIHKQICLFVSLIELSFAG